MPIATEVEINIRYQGEGMCPWVRARERKLFSLARFLSSSISSAFDRKGFWGVCACVHAREKERERDPNGFFSPLSFVCERCVQQSNHCQQAFDAVCMHGKKIMSAKKNFSLEE